MGASLPCLLTGAGSCRGKITLALAGLFLFWPAFVWHGKGGFTGTEWEWDIHTTVACCIWWESLLLIAVVIAVVLVLEKANSQRIREAEREASLPPLR